MKHVIALAVIALLALVAAVILTIVLSPFWNWFEGYSGIESMGHSGPANWCFVVMFIILLALGWGAWWFVGRHKN